MEVKVLCTIVAILSQIYTTAASPFLSVPENNTIVCNGTNMILSCTVLDTAALRWIVGSTLITCPGNIRFQSGSPCLGGTAKVYAIVTSVVHLTRFPVPRSDITSSITITNISRDTEVRCENQIEEHQTSEILHVSSPPLPPTGLNVTVSGTVANIAWDSPAEDDIDFYKVEVYKSGSNHPLHSSRVKDTSQQVAIHPTTSELVVYVTASNECGQLSRENISSTFDLQDPTMATSDTSSPPCTCTDQTTATSDATTAGSDSTAATSEASSPTCDSITAADDARESGVHVFAGIFIGSFIFLLSILHCIVKG